MPFLPDRWVPGLLPTHQLPGRYPLPSPAGALNPAGAKKPMPVIPFWCGFSPYPTSPNPYPARSKGRGGTLGGTGGGVGDNGEELAFV